MTLWYLTRAAGTAALVLLTLTTALGIADLQELQIRRVPRFLVDGLHRRLALLSVVMLVVHIVATVLDGFTSISLIDAVVPFTGSYRPLWLGLGALSFDLLIAVAVTSALRQRIGLRAWRAIHWTAYACWPLALIHGLGTGTDVRQGWELWLSLGCAAIVAVAVLVRAGAVARRAPGALAGACAALLALAIGLAIWLPSGPLGSGWAKKAGTPSSLLTSSSSTRGSGTP